MKNKRFGFTLTEVLLAVAIVGIIAALVLPALITKYQNKALDQKFQREKQTIENTINGLAAAENKGSFFETVMYTAEEEPESYKDTSEEFLKKYMRVSKLCGDNNGDCFAKTYYEYKDGDKVVYTPTYKGSCAILKNGSSICITPQIVSTGVTGIIDLNGTKGPNVLGKDLRVFAFDNQTRRGVSKATKDVADTEFLVDIKESNPCETDQFGLACCILHLDEIGEGQPYRACCNHPEIEATYGETCKKTPEPPKDPCEEDPHSDACCLQIAATDPDKFQYVQYKYCCNIEQIKKSAPYCSWVTINIKCQWQWDVQVGSIGRMNFVCYMEKFWTDDEYSIRLWIGDYMHLGTVYSNELDTRFNQVPMYYEYLNRIHGTIKNRRTGKNLPYAYDIYLQHNPITHELQYRYEGPGS